MKMSLTRFGELFCRLVSDGTSKHEWLVVLCHGFGAPGDDLVDLAPAMLQLAPELGSKVIFAFPEAPLTLDFAGFGQARAWWHLDLEGIARARALGLTRTLAQEKPEGLEPACNKLMTMLEELQAQTGVPMKRTVLGGFSQGAMLATDLTLRGGRAPRGLFCLSGNLLNAQEWADLARRRKGLEVFMSHGRQDPVLPYGGAEDLRECLETAGCHVTFLPFDGGHTINHEGVAEMARRLASYVSANS
jgi:phospholipase/carboxylesterase